MTALYKVAQNTSRLLLAAGDLITGWLLIRQSEVALGALAGEVSRRTGSSTRASSPRPGSSPPRCCRG